MLVIWIKNLINMGEHGVNMLLPQHYILNRWIDMSTVAAVFMLILLLFMKYFGACRLLMKVRKELIVSAYEILVYHRNARIVFQAQVKLLWNNLKFMIFLLPGMIIGGLLFAILYNPMIERYAFRPFHAGENIVAKVTSSNNAQWTIKDNKQMEILTRVYPVSSETSWFRLAPKRAGILRVEKVFNTKNTLYFDVGSPDRPAIPRQNYSGITLNVHYPQRLWLGWSHGWLAFFFAMCFIFSVPIARWLKVSF